MNLKELILNIVNDENYEVMTIKELEKYLQVDKYTKKVVYEELKNLEKENKLRISHKKKIMPLSEEEKSLIGEISLAQAGYGFFISDNKDFKDVFISKDNLNKAFDGDKVKIEIIKAAEKGKNAEGRVVEIIKRANKKVVGTFQESKGFGFVVADNKSIGQDIYIDKKLSKKAKNKDIYSLAAQHGIPYQFSKETKKEVLYINKEVKEDELENRTDFRDLFTVTIDGRDSKDFDDAISIEKNGENYDLYVHIADVSHYVKRSTAIDYDAYDRGNSTYLYNVVIPMLPKELSNGICSLNPNVDRLTVSLKMTINKKGKIIANDFYKSVINSNHRLVYDDVNKFIDDSDSSVYEDEILKEKLLIFNDLHKILRAKREDRGAIDFDFTESQIDVTDDGKVLNISVHERGSGNKMIEEFMLAANETVATLFGYMDFPFIYRIHEKPSKDKLDGFKQALNTMGYNIRGNELHPKDFQRILEEVEGESEANVINLLMLRTMQKAKYSKKRDIHFGLSTEFYTHFTSPIRRYPDLIVHRLLKTYIDNRLNKLNQVSLENSLEKSSEHLSMTERRSEDTERDVEDLMKCKYMRRFIGEEFTGTISSVTDFGIFVELDNTVEGLFMYKFSPDRFEYQEESLKAVNTDNHKIYSIGDEVRIKVINVDIYSRNIDFDLLEENETVSQQQESLS